MNKKTVASVTLLVASMAASAQRMPPNPNLPLKTYCLSMSERDDKSVVVGTCDLSEKNRRTNRIINENGCADDQAALQTYTVKMASCPTPMQL